MKLKGLSVMMSMVDIFSLGIILIIHNLNSKLMKYRQKTLTRFSSTKFDITAYGKKIKFNNNIYDNRVMFQNMPLVMFMRIKIRTYE